MELNQQAKERVLAVLKNRPTAYELVMTNGQQTYRVTYSSSTSRHSLLACIRQHGEHITRIAGSDRITFARKASEGATIGDWTIRFTGRTHREAICAGSFERVEDVA